MVSKMLIDSPRMIIRFGKICLDRNSYIHVQEQVDHYAWSWNHYHMTVPMGLAVQEPGCGVGAGTYEKGKYICASRVGKVVKREIESNRFAVEVVCPENQEGCAPVNYPVVPKIGDVILGKVIRLSQKLASVDILSVENSDVKEIFTGIVRAQDIRTSEIDSVELHRCFRPRDIIRARVLSLGDSRAYYLSTAEPELGVVSSVSQNGNKMVPLNESAMHCVETGEKEERKAAKLSAKDTK